MADIPVKSIADIEVKEQVSDNDKILILDSVSEEARLASKEELKWDKWDTWSKWDKWDKWDKGDKWDKWDTWSTWPQWVQWERWLQGLKWDKGDKWDKWDQWEKGNTWEKWDTWAEIEWVEWIDNDMVFLKNDWTYVTLEWAKDDLKWTPWANGKDWKDWKDWADWVHIVSAAFNGNDIDFTESDWNIVTLEDAKVELKWDKWDTGNKWDKWDKGDKWDTGLTWPSINSADFNGNDIVFWKTDWTSVTLTDAKTTLTWPQWVQWEQGIQWVQWPAATISVWSTSTWLPWTSASVVNSWTTWAAILDFTIPQWAKWDTWATWQTWATGNGIASITSEKSWKVTTVTITETNWDDYSFHVLDWADWEWAWDVVWPSSSTDWNVALFDWATGKLIKDSWKAFTAAWIWALADSTKYWKTLDLSIDTTTYIVTATLKDQDWTTLSTDTIDLPLESVVVWGSYDSVNKKVVLTLENGNTVEFSVADLVAWLQSEITSSNKLDADLVDDSTSTNKFVTASDKTTWNWKQDALIAWTNITIAADWKTISATDTTYSAATSSTLWLVKLWDDTVQSVAANAVTGTASRTYAMQVNSSGQLVVNVPREDHTYTALDFDIKNLADNTGLRTTWSWKQDALSTQTAYTSKWTSTKVPTITTNTLWQVIGITETSIAFPVTSVNWSTWAITWLQTTANLKTDLTDNSDSYYPSQKAVKTAVDAKQATLVSWTNIKTINGNSVLWSGDLTVSWLPSGWTEWQILMIVSWTPTWVTPTAKWFKMLSPSSPLTVPYDWYGTEAQYSSATKSNDTEYRTV